MGILDGVSIKGRWDKGLLVGQVFEQVIWDESEENQRNGKIKGVDKH